MAWWASEEGGEQSFGVSKEHADAKRTKTGLVSEREWRERLELQRYSDYKSNGVCPSSASLLTFPTGMLRFTRRD